LVVDEEEEMAMGAVIVRRLVKPRWDALSRSGMRRGISDRVLGEEERAVENVYIKVCFFCCCILFLPFSSIASASFEEFGILVFCFSCTTWLCLEVL
jgi:hypothetical protein